MKDDAERAREIAATVVNRAVRENSFIGPGTVADFRMIAEQAALLAFAQQPEGWVSIEKTTLKVLLPPGSCEREYLDGWVDGQTYLIGNIVGWSAMLDAAPAPGEER